MPVVLWTDALIYLLLVVSIGFGVYAARREHLRAPWRRVLRSKLAMGSLVVLACYVAIGLLDTVHFHPRAEGKGADGAGHTGQVLSLLDLWLTPLREHQEKTYSAPLATHLFVKEAIEGPDGGLVRDYPRLTWGGRHLADPERDWGWDVVRRALLGGLVGLGSWVMLSSVILWVLARRRGEALAATARRIAAGADPVPWRVALGTLAAILVLGLAVAALAQSYHVLGTDKVGEDVLYQVLKGIRTGLVIGTLTTLVMLPAAILLGIMAGYFRGWVDDLIQYLYTTLNSIPGVLLIAAAILLLQVYMSNHEDEFTSLVERADLRLLFLCLILGVTSWTGLCRLLRGEALKLREADYVQASVALGVRHFTIIGRHILPNVLHIVLITVVLDFSGLVLAEAVLSYVNIGVDPTMNSWGNMINSARLELARDPMVWWSLAAAFAFMFTLVLAANLFADAVRDAFDPRLRSGG
jgi:peptide/nickel transport system permease protein